MFKKLLFWQPVGFSPQGFLVNLLSFIFEWIILASIIFLSGYLFFTNNLSQLVLFWKILLISEVVHQVGKFFSWPRPFYKSGVGVPGRFVAYSKGSFPSGHGLRAVIILYFLFLESGLLFWIFTPPLVLSVISRVVFSLHYPIDIIGGAMLGYLLISFIK